MKLLTSVFAILVCVSCSTNLSVQPIVPSTQKVVATPAPITTPNPVPANEKMPKEIGDPFDFKSEKEISEYVSIPRTGTVLNGLKIRLTVYTGKEKSISEFSLGGSRLIDGSKERDQHYEENKILEALTWEKTVGDPKDYQSTTFILKGVGNFSTKGGDGVSTPITYFSMHLIDKSSWKIVIPANKKYTFYFDIPDITGIPIERLKNIDIY